LFAIRKAAADAGRPVLAGLGIMPETTLDAANALLDLEPDMVLVLSLDPRTKNPSDITASCERLKQLRQRCSASNPVLAFDGGVTLDSIEEIAACRPDLIVSGSAVFKAENPKQAFVRMIAVL
jgi:ribulose-phosphate 3-epimerase